jgi:tryptophan 2,3-dioxygenase
MREDKMVKALEAFSIHEYIQISRTYGRSSGEKALKDMRHKAVTLYEQILLFRQNESFISKELDVTLDLAERVLVSEYFQLNNPVPRYLTYTNNRVLSWSLGTHRRGIFATIWARCWMAIHLLVRDLLSFEICSLAGAQPWQQDNCDLEAVANRVERFQGLLSHVPNQPSLDSTSISLDNPPDDWFSYALDLHKVLALVHLTALPQSKEHDEVLFLRTIHITDCCFWGILTAVMAAIESGKQGRMDVAIECLTIAIPFAEFLVPLFQAFKTMPPAHFAEFRDATGDASAIQSRTYQLMQIFTQGLDERKARIIAGIPDMADLLFHWHPGFVNLSKFLQKVEQQGTPEGETLIAKAALIDKALYAWRCLHLGIARRYLPANVIGTGGTLGVPYLEMDYRHKIFPITQQHSISLDVVSSSSLCARPILSYLN